MKALLVVLGLFGSSALAAQPMPKLQIEYSYALDLACATKVEPETLKPSQSAMIGKISIYRSELRTKLPWFEAEWGRQGEPLLKKAAELIGKPFQFRDLQAAVFLCPRLPSMGTPLAFNVLPYLESSAKYIEGSGGQPMPAFFFVSTAFHEVLHKYINGILDSRPSAILLKLNETDLYEAHLHVFALQKRVFESLKLGHLLPQIEKLEALHGTDYARAWKTVHGDEAMARALLDELRK